MNGTRTDKAEAEASDAAVPDPKALEAIGKALAAHYASLIDAPLPDKFVELLARLEEGPVSQTKRRRDALG
jgi:Anti-sigma factor NepR